MATHGCQLPKRPPGRVGQGDNASAGPHERNGFAHAHQECLGLRVHGKIEHIQRDGHRPFVKRGHFRTGIVHKNVQRPELGFDPREDATNLLGLRYIRLHDKAVGAASAQLLQRGFGLILFLIVVNRDLRPTLCELQSDAAADSP